MQVASARTEAIGGLERIRNTPLPASYDVFTSSHLAVRIASLLYFHEPGSRHQNPISGVLIVLLFLAAERIGAYVEGPFDPTEAASPSRQHLPHDQPRSSDRDVDHVQHLNSDPVR